MEGQQFRTQDETLIAAKLLQRLEVKNGKLFLDKKPINITLPGEPGGQGQPGKPPEHEWDGTKIRFKLPDKTWGEWTDLKGKPGNPGKTPVKGVHYRDGKDADNGYTPVKGKDYFDGKPGRTPKKGVDYFDGDAGKTPVKGKDYDDGDTGDVGSPPAHRWQGTQLQFQNPDGSWGRLVDLAGKPGKDAKTPIKGIDYFDGKPGKNAVIPEALDMTILIDANLILDKDTGAFTLSKKFAQVRIYPKG